MPLSTEMYILLLLLLPGEDELEGGLEGAILSDEDEASLGDARPVTGGERSRRRGPRAPSSSSHAARPCAARAPASAGHELAGMQGGSPVGTQGASLVGMQGMPLVGMPWQLGAAQLGGLPPWPQAREWLLGAPGVPPAGPGLPGTDWLDPVPDHAIHPVEELGPAAQRGFSGGALAAGPQEGFMEALSAAGGALTRELPQPSTHAASLWELLPGAQQPAAPGSLHPTEARQQGAQQGLPAPPQALAPGQQPQLWQVSSMAALTCTHARTGSTKQVWPIERKGVKGGRPADMHR